MCEFDKNRPSGYRYIQGVENGELVVPLINTLVHHTSFLAADTQPCVLITCVQGICLVYMPKPEGVGALML